MCAFIQSISTSVPGNSYSQEELRDRMKTVVGKTEKERRIIHSIYSRSGIRTRYSVLDDFHDNGTENLYFNGHGTSPGTGARNRIYETEGRKLFIHTAKKVIADNEGVSPADITHLITISCTGFYAPGPEVDIIRSLGLNPRIERYNLGFMGCYAAIPGLKLAARICRLDPRANVMVIATELCTLHFQGGANTDELISASVFSDGAAGTLVSGSRPTAGTYLRVHGFASALSDEGSEDMAWTIGDTGFNMVLSTYVPEILSRNLNGFLYPVLRQYGLEMNQIDRWAVHPGGRAILDRIEKQLLLPEESLRYSRKILGEYGNMSSATLLFVLKEMLEESKPLPEPENVFAMAFGPGLTIESALLEKNRVSRDEASPV